MSLSNPFGGVDALVRILKEMNGAAGKNILDTISNDDSELAEQIKKKMFLFDDLGRIPNRDIQRIYREVPDNRLWAMALKGCSDELKTFVYSNVSKRMAEAIREEAEILGAVRRSDVDEAQQKIMNIAKQLESNGEIILTRLGGGDDVW